MRRLLFARALARVFKSRHQQEYSVSYSYARVPLYKGSGAFLVVGALCNAAEESKVQEKDFRKDNLIKQASIGVVNSATSLLTFVTAAMIDAQDQYIQVMEEYASLSEAKISLNIIGVEDEYYQEMLSLRADIQEKREAWLILESQMLSTTSVLNAAAEMAFGAGAEYVGIAANERLVSAQQQLHLAQNKIREMETELIRVQAKDIVNDEICK